MSSNFKIFCVSFEDEYKEYIVAETPEQALDYYNERADDEFKVTIEAYNRCIPHLDKTSDLVYPETDCKFYTLAHGSD